MAILNGIVTVLPCDPPRSSSSLPFCFQPGESNGLGAIAGGAETFFGKNKAKSMEVSSLWRRKGFRRYVYHCALIVAMIG